MYGDLLDSLLSINLVFPESYSLFRGPWILPFPEQLDLVGIHSPKWCQAFFWSMVRKGALSWPGSISARPGASHQHTEWCLECHSQPFGPLLCSQAFRLYVLEPLPGAPQMPCCLFGALWPTVHNSPLWPHWQQPQPLGHMPSSWKLHLNLQSHFSLQVMEVLPGHKSALISPAGSEQSSLAGEKPTSTKVHAQSQERKGGGPRASVPELKEVLLWDIFSVSSYLKFNSPQFCKVTSSRTTSDCLYVMDFCFPGLRSRNQFVQWDRHLPTIVTCEASPQLSAVGWVFIIPVLQMEEFHRWRIRFWEVEWYAWVCTAINIYVVNGTQYHWFWGLEVAEQAEPSLWLHGLPWDWL